MMMNLTLKFRIVRRSLVIAGLLLTLGETVRCQQPWEITDTVPSSGFAYHDVLLSCSGTDCIGSSEKIAATDTSALLFASSDGGRTWTSLPKLPSINPLAAITAIQQIDNSNALIAGTQGLILRSSDHGQHWTADSSPVSNTIGNIHSASKSEGIAVAYNPIHVIRYDGSRWSIVPFSPRCFTGRVINNYKYLDSIYQNIGDYDGQLYVHAYGEGKYRLICNGYYSDSLKTTIAEMYETRDNWKTVDSFLIPFWPLGDGYKHLGYTFDWFDCMFGSGDTILVYGSSSVSPAFNFSIGILCRTFDGGKHWSRLVDSLYYHGFYNLSPVSSHLMFSSLRDRSTFPYGQMKLLRSTDLGSSWVFDTVLFDRPIDTTTYGTNVETHYAMTNEDLIASFFSRNAPSARASTLLARLPIPQQSVSATSETRTMKVFPNPATLQLNIRINSQITILDALGRAFKIPNHDGTLDISALPPGVYYISDGSRRAKFVKE